MSLLHYPQVQPRYICSSLDILVFQILRCIVPLFDVLECYPSLALHCKSHFLQTLTTLTPPSNLSLVLRTLHWLPLRRTWTSSLQRPYLRCPSSADSPLISPEFKHMQCTHCAPFSRPFHTEFALPLFQTPFWCSSSFCIDRNEIFK